jgi:hypothetical protein
VDWILEFCILPKIRVLCSVRCRLTYNTGITGTILIKIKFQGYHFIRVHNMHGNNCVCNRTMVEGTHINTLNPKSSLVIQHHFLAQHFWKFLNMSIYSFVSTLGTPIIPSTSPLFISFNTSVSQ